MMLNAQKKEKGTNNRQNNLLIQKLTLFALFKALFQFLFLNIYIIKIFDIVTLMIFI
jgi:hypothetical protein